MAIQMTKIEDIKKYEPARMDILGIGHLFEDCSYPYDVLNNIRNMNPDEIRRLNAHGDMNNYS